MTLYFNFSELKGNVDFLIAECLAALLVRGYSLSWPGTSLEAQNIMEDSIPYGGVFLSLCPDS